MSSTGYSAEITEQANSHPSLGAEYFAAREAAERFLAHWQGRSQRGEVLRIEATWHGWSANHAPLIGYTLRHPTYRNNQFHAGVDNIGGLVERASS